jgi:hypothetical protein
MAARKPSTHVFLGRPFFLLSPGIHSIINLKYLIFTINYFGRKLKKDDLKFSNEMKIYFRILAEILKKRHRLGETFVGVFKH